MLCNVIILFKSDANVRYGSTLPMAKRFMPVGTRLGDPSKQERCSIFYLPVILWPQVSGVLLPWQMMWNGLSCSSCPGERRFPLQTTLCHSLAELPGQKSLLNFPFLSHCSPEFMKRKTHEEEHLELKKLQIGRSSENGEAEKNSRGEMK